MLCELTAVFPAGGAGAQALLAPPAAAAFENRPRARAVEPPSITGASIQWGVPEGGGEEEDGESAAEVAEAASPSAEQPQEAERAAAFCATFDWRRRRKARRKAGSEARGLSPFAPFTFNFHSLTNAPSACPRGRPPEGDRGQGGEIEAGSAARRRSQAWLRPLPLRSNNSPTRTREARLSSRRRLEAVSGLQRRK